MLANASYRAAIDGFDYEHAMTECGSPAFEPFPFNKPLAFLHIPKTAGASIIQALESYFDDNLIAPPRNLVDFYRLPENCTDYVFFRGHFAGGDIAFLPKGADMFTIVRDPVELVVSMYHYLKRFNLEDWDASWSKQPLGDAMRGEDKGSKKRAAIQAEMCRQHPLPELLDNPELRSWRVFRNVLLNGLGGAKQTLQSTVPASPGSDGLQEQFTHMHEVASGILNHALMVGDQKDLNLALLALAAKRRWPAPPQPPRIHDFGGKTASEAADPDLRARVLSLSPDDFSLYAMANEIAQARLDEIEHELGEPLTIDAVNEQYRNHFFRNAPVTLGFDRDASKAWSGCGWGYREYVNNTIAVRRIADGRAASFLTRVPPDSSDYLLQILVRDAESAEQIEAIEVEVGGRKLPRVAIAWLKDEGVRLQWQVQREIIAGDKGNLELKLINGLEHKEKKLLLRKASFMVWPIAPAN